MWRASFSRPPFTGIELTSCCISGQQFSHFCGESSKTEVEEISSVGEDFVVSRGLFTAAPVAVMI